MQSFRYLLQRIARFFVAGVLTVLPLAITVGIAIWVSDFIGKLVGPNTALGGMLKDVGIQLGWQTTMAYAAGWMVATIHYLSAAVLTVFLGVHLYLITFGDEPGFGLKSMLDGQHRRQGEK